MDNVKKTDTVKKYNNIKVSSVCYITEKQTYSSKVVANSLTAIEKSYFRISFIYLYLFLPSI